MQIYIDIFFSFLILKKAWMYMKKTLGTKQSVTVCLYVLQASWIIGTFQCHEPFLFGKSKYFTKWSIKNVSKLINIWY